MDKLKKMEDNLGERGHIVHVPVFNSCERLFCVGAKSDGQNTIRACEIHKPAVPLPEANAATLRDIYCKWSALTSKGVGSKLTSAKLEHAMASTPAWKSLYVTRDNLVTNDSVLGL